MSDLDDGYDKILFEVERYLIQNGASIYLHVFLRFNYDKIRNRSVILILAPSDDVMSRIVSTSGKSIDEISTTPEGIDILNNFLSGTPINKSYPVYTAINGTIFGQTVDDLSKLNFVADKKFGDITIHRIANFNTLNSIISQKFGNITLSVINSGIKRDQQQIQNLIDANSAQYNLPISNIIGDNSITNFDNLPNPVIRKIVLNLTPTNVVDICRASGRFNGVICDSEDFWNEKTRKDKPNHRGMIGGSWKETYRLTGRLYTFGDGTDGKLGHGDTENQFRPKLVESLVDVTFVSCGPLHTAAISGGRLYTFGHETYNDAGQLLPRLAEDLDNVTVVSAGQEDDHVISNGQLYNYQQTDYSHINRGYDENRLELDEALSNTTFVAESPNMSHEAVIADGRLYIRGLGNDGQLGLGGGVELAEQFTLVDVDENGQTLDNVTTVSCGYRHTAVISNGRLYTFGNGQSGELGHGDYQTRFRPKLVEGLVNVTSVSCGQSHTAAVSDGVLYTFGFGTRGQLGYDVLEDENRPRLVEGLDNVTMAACGFSHTAAISDGRLYTFGDATFGQLGHGDNQSYRRPKLVEGLISVTFVSCGYNHTAAIVG